MPEKEIFRTIGNKDRLVDRVVNEIQQLIIDRKLEPGVHLPPERDFAEQIGVSRTVLREAIQVLEVKGLLKVKHGIGTIVCEVGRAQLSEPLNMLFLTRGITLDDLHQVRTVLEVEIAYVAAKNATEQDILELKEVLKTLETNMDNPEGFAKWDTKFHNTLAKISKNPLLVMLLDSINGLMNEVRISVSNYPDLFNKVMPDHYELLSFIEARDPSNAKKVMRKHLTHAREIQQQYIKDNGSEFKIFGEKIIN